MLTTRCSCQIVVKLEFSLQIFEKLQLFHADRETADLTKLIVAFQTYAPKKGTVLFRLHGKSCYANALQCKVVRTLSILLNV
jgi:hypothetical protein